MQRLMIWFFAPMPLRMYTFAWILAMFACAFYGPSELQAQITKGLALVGGTLLDGDGARIKNSLVLIRGERIEAVGTVESMRVPADYETVSTEGMTVLPGLWDMHTHFQYLASPDVSGWNRSKTSQYEKTIMPATALQALIAGVTSARDLGAPPEAILAVKSRIDKGELPGPTIYVAGPQLDPEPPDWATQYRWKIADASDARIKVNKLADMGVSWIKVTNEEKMPREVISAIVAAAHSRGLRVTGHARTLGEIRRGLEGGVDGFEHINLQETEYPNDIMEGIRLRTSTGKLYWTPTVYSALSTTYLRANAEILDGPENYLGVPVDLAAELRLAFKNFEPRPIPNAESILKHKTAQLRAAGVQLLIGTDTGNPGVVHSHSMWQEMDSWVSVLGVAPLDAIRMSTSEAAAISGVGDQNGTIVQGKLADIIAVRGDPLRHMDVLRDPAIVIKHGHRYK